MAAGGQQDSDRVQRLALHLSREAMDVIAAGGDTTRLRVATTKALQELDRDERRTLVATMALLIATLAAHLSELERQRILQDATIGAGLGASLRMVVHQVEAALRSTAGR